MLENKVCVTEATSETESSAGWEIGWPGSHRLGTRWSVGFLPMGTVRAIEHIRQCRDHIYEISYFMQCPSKPMCDVEHWPAQSVYSRIASD